MQVNKQVCDGANKQSYINARPLRKSPSGRLGTILKS